MTGFRSFFPGRKKTGPSSNQISCDKTSPDRNNPVFDSCPCEQKSPIVKEDGTKFCSIPSSFRQIFDIPEYRFDDIRPDDLVIDIGANVGAFCIRAARSAKKVTAVEPVTTAILRKNIALNNAPVDLVEAALGNGGEQEISWDTGHAVVPTYSLREIIRFAGGCTFLKCDCEGAEWLISPVDMKGIRRIEMELHLPPISGPPNSTLLDYIGERFDFEIERKPVHSTLGVMGILHAVRK